MNIQEIFGGVVALMRHSPIHRSYRVSDLDRLLVPPLMLDQFAIVKTTEGSISGFASWAYLTETAVSEFRDGNNFLEPQDWASGTIQFLVDVIAPDRQFVRPLVNEIKASIKGRVLFRRDYRGNRARMGSALISERHGK